MSASATNGLMTSPVSCGYTARMKRQLPVHVSTSTSTKQAPTPLFAAPLSPPATPRPNWRMAPLFAFAKTEKVVAFLGSSVEKIIPSRIWSFAESTFRAFDARSSRSLLNLSAALQVAAP